MPVFLVGAGPGDPELLTLKARRLLETAEAVIYDALVNPAILAFAPPAAERLYAGKRRGAHAASQREINSWMIERARRGLRVVRLKGGDPGLFGRLGEEIAALDAAGLAWEAVPGVSAGTGVPTAAGIPLTLRGVASSVRFLTHLADLPAHPIPGETLVIFMGVATLPALVTALRDHGWPAATPVAIIAHGTLPQQRSLSATLADISPRARAAHLQTPALIIVGAVVGTHPPKDREAPDARTSTLETPVAPPGLILFAHGSPLPQWHAGVENLARELAAPGQFSRAAYLPPAQPGLEDVVAAAVAAGQDRLVVVPYFLAPGLHVTRDLPEMLAALRLRFPQLRLAAAECLEGHPALATIVRSRAAAASARLTVHSRQ